MGLPHLRPSDEGGAAVPPAVVGAQSGPALRRPSGGEEVRSTLSAAESPEEPLSAALAHLGPIPLQPCSWEWEVWLLAMTRAAAAGA